MKRLVFSELAENDILTLTVFLAEKVGPDVAVKFALDLKERIRLLQHSPLMGRATSRRHGLREVIFDEYIVVYAVQANQVRVVRVWHGKQRRPTKPTPAP